MKSKNDTLIKSKKLPYVLTLVFVALFIGIYTFFFNDTAVKQTNVMTAAPRESDEEWRKLLTPNQYYILREKGTDQPYTAKEMLNEKRKGTYVTADCNEPVFRSEAKYESGTGWPSFYEPINKDAVVEIDDSSFGATRTEIVGRKCGGHLGHVFTDGPQPTGLRYCINATALKFIPDEIQ